MKFSKLSLPTIPFLSQSLARIKKSENNPKRDWLILLCVFVVVTILGGLYAAQLYVKVSVASSQEVAEQEVGSISIDRAELSNVVSLFETRKERHEELLEAYPIIVIEEEDIEDAQQTATSVDQISSQ